MTREELKEHCEKTVEQCEMWAIHRGEEPSGKVYEEHKAVLDILEQQPCDAISREELLKAIDTWDKFGCDADTKLVRYQDHYVPYIHYDDVIKCIKGMPSVTQKSGKWIPVSEKLPKEREWYLAVFKEKDTAYQLIPRVADYIGRGENKWQIIDEEGLCKEYRDILECIAWMPLPKPYETQESEE